jgi:ribosomal protein S18 acetylase RimI-like enzyme
MGLVQSLEWDSAHFGRRIARIHYEGLSPAKLAQAVSCADESAVDCLYLLAPASDTPMIGNAEDLGFRFADMRLRLGADISSAAGMEDVDYVRQFRPSDAARLKEIARVSHTDSRFFRDPHFSRTDCQRMYELWIEKSYAGWASFVLVADAGGGVSGYITCHQHETAASIGLFAVSEEARGTGVGSALVRAACARAQQQGASRAAVVTQGANPRAQRVYQRCGFITESIQFWLHRWRSS